MVIKTDPCAYTEMRIWPGRGTKFASKDGKTRYFLNSKVRSLYHQNIKPVKLTWTQAWRRQNKKVRIEEVQKKRTRKTTRVQKAVVGMSLEEIKRRRNEDAATRDKAIEAAKKDIKDRNLKKIQSKKADKSKAPKAAQAAKAPVAKNVPKQKVQKGGKR